MFISNSHLPCNEISLAMTDDGNAAAIHEIESLLSEPIIAPQLPALPHKTWASYASDTLSMKNREIENIIAELEISRKENNVQQTTHDYHAVSDAAQSSGDLPWKAWIPL